MKLVHIKPKEATILTNKINRATTAQQREILKEELDAVQHALERLNVARRAGLNMKTTQKELAIIWEIFSPENNLPEEREKYERKNLKVQDVNIPIIKANKDVILNKIIMYTISGKRGYFVFEKTVKTLFDEEVRRYACEKYDLYSVLPNFKIEKLEELVKNGVLEFNKGTSVTIS